MTIDNTLTHETVRSPRSEQERPPGSSDVGSPDDADGAAVTGMPGIQKLLDESRARLQAAQNHHTNCQYAEEILLYRTKVTEWKVRVGLSRGGHRRVDKYQAQLLAMSRLLMRSSSGDVYQHGDALTRILKRDRVLGLRDGDQPPTVDTGIYLAVLESQIAWATVWVRGLHKWRGHTGSLPQNQSSS